MQNDKWCLFTYNNRGICSCFVKMELYFNHLLKIFPFNYMFCNGTYQHQYIHILKFVWFIYIKLKDIVNKIDSRCWQLESVAIHHTALSTRFGSFRRFVDVLSPIVARCAPRVYTQQGDVQFMRFHCQAWLVLPNHTHTHTHTSTILCIFFVQGSTLSWFKSIACIFSGRATLSHNFFSAISKQFTF